MAPPRPTFLVIGAQKSATRWLRHNLGLHPQIHTVAPEISFFDHDGRYALGLDWYRSQFAGWNGETQLGESTPGYLMYHQDPDRVAQRIESTLGPGVALLAVLRDPIARARSALVHHIRNERLPPWTTLSDVAERDPEQDRLGIISGGWYAASLEPYVQRFGERLLVLLHDDVRVAPEDVFVRAVAHLGVDDGFVPEELTAVRYSAKTMTGPHQGSAAAHDLDEDEHERLASFFRDDVDRLSQMFDLDLDVWLSRPDDVSGSGGDDPAASNAPA